MVAGNSQPIPELCKSGLSFGGSFNASTKAWINPESIVEGMEKEALRLPVQEHLRILRGPVSAPMRSDFNLVDGFPPRDSGHGSSEEKKHKKRKYGLLCHLSLPDFLLLRLRYAAVWLVYPDLRIGTIPI